MQSRSRRVNNRSGYRGECDRTVRPAEPRRLFALPSLPVSLTSDTGQLRKTIDRKAGNFSGARDSVDGVIRIRADDAVDVVLKEVLC